MVYTVNTLSSATYPFSNFSPRKDGNLNSSRILLLEKKTIDEKNNNIYNSLIVEKRR